MPYVAPVISVVFSWQFIFDPVNGIFMDITYEKLNIFTERINLIRSPDTAIYVAILFGIWKNFPFTYLMVLARLQAIDNTLFEAAEIDGCNEWNKFKYITLPELYFLLGALVLLRAIWGIIISLSRTAILTVFIYSFMIAWNEYLFASVFLKSYSSLYTLTIGLKELFVSKNAILDRIMAASLLSALPIIALFMTVQKYLVSGLSEGGVKG